MTAETETQLVDILEAMKGQLGAYGIAVDGVNFTIPEVADAILRMLDNAIGETNRTLELMDILDKTSDGLEEVITGLEQTIETRRADYNEVIKALGDLSFECFAVTSTAPPSRDTYNRTFQVLEKHRAIVKAEDQPPEPCDECGLPMDECICIGSDEG